MRTLLISWLVALSVFTVGITKSYIDSKNVSDNDKKKVSTNYRSIATASGNLNDDIYSKSLDELYEYKKYLISIQQNTFSHLDDLFDEQTIEKKIQRLGEIGQKINKLRSDNHFNESTLETKIRENKPYYVIDFYREEIEKTKKEIFRLTEEYDNLESSLDENEEWKRYYNSKLSKLNNDITTCAERIQYLEEQEREDQERIAREQQEREDQERIAREQQEREDQERIAREQQEREDQERIAREQQRPQKFRRSYNPSPKRPYRTPGQQGLLDRRAKRLTATIQLPLRLENGSSRKEFHSKRNGDGTVTYYGKYSDGTEKTIKIDENGMELESSVSNPNGVPFSEEKKEKKLSKAERKKEEKKRKARLKFQEKAEKHFSRADEALSKYSNLTSELEQLAEEYESLNRQYADTKDPQDRADLRREIKEKQKALKILGAKQKTAKRKLNKLIARIERNKKNLSEEQKDHLDHMKYRRENIDDDTKNHLAMIRNSKIRIKETFNSQTVTRAELGELFKFMQVQSQVNQQLYGPDMIYNLMLRHGLYTNPTGNNLFYPNSRYPYHYPYGSNIPGPHVYNRFQAPHYANAHGYFAFGQQPYGNNVFNGQRYNQGRHYPGMMNHGPHPSPAFFQQGVRRINIPTRRVIQL